MLPLPTRFAGIIPAFAPLFVHSSWLSAGLAFDHLIVQRASRSFWASLAG